MLQRLKKWSKNSLTIAWGYIQILVGILTTSVSQAANLVTDPDVKSALASMSLPSWATLGLAIVGAITIMARLRTVNHKTDENNQIVD